MFQILVVDDDKNARTLMQAVLEREGFSVATAQNGVEALALMEKEHIDLIVVDIMMPLLDGYELTSELRTTYKELPILMVSAKQFPEDRKKGFFVGIDGYMNKPIDDEEFVLQIRSLLRRAKIYSQRKIVVGDVTLNYDALTVSKGNDTQELPQKEFLLLYKLLSHPDKIFTRIQLMDEIWGVECDTGWDTLTVHIARLRKRFEDYDEFEIVSVRGLGYKAVRKV